MAIAHLPKWDLTAIEIALDLETPRLADPSGCAFSGPAEPRICLVAAFALTPQLKRIAAAVERAVPARLPSRLRIARSTTRQGIGAASDAISIQPMRTLLRLQQKLVRAIKPGLADAGSVISFGHAPDMDEAAGRFIRDFIPCEVLPVFEPPYVAAGFETTDLRGLGITIYRLGHRGTPESILAHWAYAQRIRAATPLASGP